MENWSRDSHELNKDPFEGNILEKYNCEKFSKFLIDCTTDYLAKTTPFDWFPNIVPKKTSMYPSSIDSFLSSMKTNDKDGAEISPSFL